MNKLLERVLIWGGVLAPLLWVTTTIYIATLNPEYSHFRQFISELGEKGSATELLKRYLANYPIGILFIGFGVFIVRAFWRYKLAALSGLLIIVHGVTNLTTGAFPCDPGCHPVTPSLSQHIHTASAAVGFCAMLLSIAIWGFISNEQLSARYLKTYSILTVIIGSTSLILMSAAMKEHEVVGLYQRLGVGALYLWLMVFSIYILVNWPRLNAKTKLAP